MSEALEPRVLVPIEVLGDTPGVGATVGLVRSVPVVLLGYKVVPEQTAPGQMQEQFEEEAMAELETHVEAFERVNADVSKRLVFTPDAQETFERVANEEACTAVLLARPADQMEELLVPVRGDANLGRLVRVTARLLEGTELRVTLLHVASQEEELEPGELLLRGAREALVEAGADASRVEVRVEASEDPMETVAAIANGFDALVLGETQPRLGDVLFGEAHERVGAAFAGPILVVRREVGGRVPAVPDSNPDT